MMQELPEDARQAQQLLQPLPSDVAVNYFHEVSDCKDKEKLN